MKKFLRSGYTTGACAAAGVNVTLHPMDASKFPITAINPRVLR